MPKGTHSQRKRARKVAREMERLSEGILDCTVDDWNEYGSFQVVVQYPMKGGLGLRNITRKVKAAVRSVDDAYLDDRYGKHNNGIEHPRDPLRGASSMVHLTIPKR